MTVTNFELVPILLDIHEVYKLTTKFYEPLNSTIEASLIDFYFRFNPERVLNFNNSFSIFYDLSTKKNFVQ
jgi:hypothetical protein